MDDRVFRAILFLAMVVLATMVGLLLALHAPNYESCMRDCAKKYRLNIDNSWTGCEALCEETFKG